MNRARTRDYAHSKIDSVVLCLSPAQGMARYVGVPLSVEERKMSNNSRAVIIVGLSLIATSLRGYIVLRC